MIIESQINNYLNVLGSTERGKIKNAYAIT